MDDLKLFGLTGYEIKIYETLLKQGKISAKEISFVSNIPPTAVYPNLKFLEEKGLIKSFSGEILRFEVVSPKVALKHLAKKKSEELFSIEKNLVPKLIHLKTQRVKKIPDPVELSEGAQASLDLMFKIVKDATDSVYILGWGFRHLKSLHRVVKLIKILGKKEIDAKIIFGDKNERTIFLAEECKKAGVGARYYPMINCSIVVADNKECKLTLKRKELDERVNIHIVDNNLVSSFSNYAILLWEKSNSF